MPLIVTTFNAQLPVTPAGKPVKLAPVAPVVLYVMLVMAVLIHTVCALVPSAEVKVMVFCELVFIANAIMARSRKYNFFINKV